MGSMYIPAHSGVDSKAVAVQRKPDALQPDDEHELQTAATHRGHQPGEVTHAERRGAEEPDIHHGIGDPQLDDAEGHQRQQAEEDCAEDIRAGPSGRRLTVGLNAVGDAGQQHRQADTEGQDARPVEAAGRADAEFPQRPDAPDGAERCRSARRPRRSPSSAIRRESHRSADRGRIRRRRPPCSRRVPCRAGSTGNASVRIADDDAISIAPPTPCTTRQPISHSAPPPR